MCICIYFFDVIVKVTARAEAALAGAAVGGAAQVGDQGRLPTRDRASGKVSSAYEFGVCV